MAQSLPKHWEVCESSGGQVFYHNTVTGETSSLDPRNREAQKTLARHRSLARPSLGLTAPSLIAKSPSIRAVSPCRVIRSNTPPPRTSPSLMRTQSTTSISTARTQSSAAIHRPSLMSEIQSLRDDFAQRLKEKDDEISKLKNCIADLAEMLAKKV